MTVDLTCPAFRVNSVPARLYLGRPQAEALGALEQGLEAGSAVMLLSGPPGIGKTALVNSFARAHGDRFEIGFLLQSGPEVGDLLHDVLLAYGRDPFGGTAEAYLSQIDGLLDDAATGRRGLLLIVDDAQRLGEDALDMLGRLTERLAGSAPVLRVVLVGLASLVSKIARPGLAGLRRRIGVEAGMGPLGPSETADYVRHRLMIAKCPCHDPSTAFDDEGLALIHELSGGEPRMIDQMAQRSLFVGNLADRRRLDAKAVRSALSECSFHDNLARPLRLTDPLPPSKRMTRSKHAGDPPRREMPLAAALRSARPEGDPDEMTARPVVAREGDDLHGLAEAADSFDFSIATATVPDKQAGPVKPAGPSYAPQEPQPLRPEPEAKLPAVVGAKPAAVASRRSRGPALLLGGGMLAAAAAGLFWLRPVTGPATAPTKPVAVAVPAAATGSVLQAASLPETTPVALMETPASAPRPDVLPPAPDASEMLTQALAVEAKDPARAARLLTRAALRGNQRAAYYLGQYYAMGTGVPADLALARAWLAKAPEIPAASSLAQALGPVPQSTEAGGVAPQPLAQGWAQAGQAELLWSAGPGGAPAGFAVEYVAGDGTEPGRVQTSLTAVLIAAPVARWRVIALDAAGQDGAASDWVEATPAR